jgi:hypothetical protein
MNEAEREAFREGLFASQATLKTAKILAQEYAKPGDSIFGTDPSLPEVLLEWTLDGHIFAVEKHNSELARVRELTAN